MTMIIPLLTLNAIIVPSTINTSSLEQLLKLAATDLTSISGIQTQQELISQYAAVNGDVAAQFAPTLLAGVGDARSGMRIASARTIAARPDADAVYALLAAMIVENDQRVVSTMARSVAAGIQRLPATDLQSLAAYAAAQFDTMIRDHTTPHELRKTLVISLGRLGSDALPYLRLLAETPAWAERLHSSLPAALAETRQPAAAADIVALYEADSNPGYRTSCLQALGMLTRQGAALPALGVQNAWLRARVEQEADPRVRAIAATTYAKWPGAANDTEFVKLIGQRIQTTTGDERKAYLRSLLATLLPPEPSIRTVLESIASSQTEPLTHRKIAWSILASHPIDPR